MAKNNTTTGAADDETPKAPPKARRKAGDLPSPPSPDPSGQVQQSNVVYMPGTTLDCFRVVLRGTTDMLTNKMSDVAIASLLSGVLDSPKNKPEKPSTHEEAAFRASHVCLLDQETVDEKAPPHERFYNHLYGFSAIALKKSAVNSMSILSIKGKAKMQGAFFIHGPFNGVIPLLSDVPAWTKQVQESRGLRDPGELMAMAAKPTVDTRPITQSASGSKGSASLSIRPMFREWFAEVFVLHYAKPAPTTSLLQMITTAGMSVGIGSYRAERSGDQFGLFGLAPLSGSGASVVMAQQMPRGWAPERYKIDKYGNVTA